MWPNMGDVLFSVMVSYMGAIELFFVLRQIYHLAFQHERRQMLASKDESLNRLQERIESEILEASKKEILGFKAMKDGVLYKDGFRIDPNEINGHDQIQQWQVIGSSTTSSAKDSTALNVTKEQEDMPDKNSHQEEACEETCIKDEALLSTSEQHSTVSEAAENERTNLIATAKSQFEDNGLNQSSPPTDSVEALPVSEQKRSSPPTSPLTSQTEFTTQPSEIQLDVNEREAPDGEDFPQQQYTDDYLRSLDGIKHRPLVREDGTGRRRAFKKHRSSESTSSRESRASREEELKMFTSLEEAEFEAIRRGDPEYVPIKYQDPNVNKMGKHQRRHRRSPIKVSDSDEQKSSLEALDEGNISPWGDVKPEHYKDTEFWRKEQELSIEEENENHVSDIKSEETEETPEDTKLKPEQSISTEGGSEDQNKKQEHVEESVGDSKSEGSEVFTEKEPLSVECHPESDVSDMKRENASQEMQQAGQITAQPSSPKNFPKMSSFEEATRSQHEDVMSALEHQSTGDREPGNVDNNELDKMGNVSSDNDSVTPLPDLSCALNYPKTSPETDNTLSNKQLDNQSELQQLNYRQRFRVDQFDQYEKCVREKENELLQATARFSQFSANHGQQPFNNQSLLHLTMPQEANKVLVPDIFDTDSNLSPLGEQNLVERNDDEISAIEAFQNDSKINEMDLEQETKDEILYEAPVKEIECTSDNDLAAGNTARKEETNKVSSSHSEIIKGISDFYDFNASINPPRSGHSPQVSPSGVDRYLQELRIPVEVPLTARGVLGVSDFYDYNAMLNRQAYGYDDKREYEAHTCSVDYILNELKDSGTTQESRLHLKITKNGEVYQKVGENDAENNEDYKNRNLPTGLRFTFDLKTPPHPNKTPEILPSGSSTLSTPQTPGFNRSFSSQSQYLERMKDEYRNNLFIRSTYVGESMDFTDDFEDLREQTRHFKRSRSKTRSPVPDDDGIVLFKRKMSHRRELQDKLLEEITKTTLNYQDLPRNINQEFLDHERRGSDSALLQKPKLLLRFRSDGAEKASISDEYDDDDLNDLEAEEYHHFRRFSLNQEYPVEEYPDDDYVYIEQIEVRTKTGTRNWIRHDYYDSSENNNLHSENDVQISSISMDATLEDDDRAEADDLDSASDDERQTVVEVEDEIDEDIWEYDRPDEYNGQSEFEEAEREVDRYAEQNADDWNENSFTEDTPEDSINIEQMYDEAMKNTEGSGIEKDYEILVEAMNRDEGNRTKSLQNIESIAIKTENSAEDILPKDGEMYSNLYGRSVSTSFLDEEVIAESTSHVEFSSRTSSTRLRSRYGLPPASNYKTYENLDNLDVDINYKPKKEYNWRRNFKLDADSSNNETDLSVSPEIKISSVELDNDDNFIDIRKFSLGGESVTLFSRSPNRETKLEDILEAEKIGEHSGLEQAEASQSEGKAHQERESISVGREEKIHKKKRGKKKSRKNSKDNVEGCEIITSEHSFFDEGENTPNLTETGAKKKIKKKRVKEDVEDNAEIMMTSSSENRSPTKTASESTTNVSPSVSQRSTVKIKMPGAFPSSKTEGTKLKSPEPLKYSEPIKSEAVASNEATFNPKIPERSTPKSLETAENADHSGETSLTPKKPKLERNDSTGVYELIKDGSMYPWF